MLRVIRAPQVMAPRARVVAQSLRLSFRGYANWPEHTVINMPALSPTMTQGGIASWSVKPGDELQPGQSIAEIETDKATMDFEFQEEGYMAQILLGDGTKDIPVGKPIAVYVENKDDVDAFKDFKPEDAADADQSAAEAGNAAPKEEPKQEEQPKQQEAPAKKSTSSKKSPTLASGDRIRASPLAKSIALEKGIALAGVKGSGPDGRILAKDLEGLAKKAPAAGGAAAATGAPAANDYEDIEITSMRKTIGSRLLASTQNAPTYIVSSTISVNKLLKLRASLNASASDRYKLSVNDLLIKAVAVAATRVPDVNASWLGDQGVIRRYKNADVSVAVATPTGLITPIVFGANQIGLSEISHKMKDLGKRAKDGKLQPQEFQGGTICISNLGMNHAVTMFTSIINPPQSAILAIGTTEKKAVPSSASEHGFIFDDVMTITGTFDHRVIDGALGGEYMKELKRVVENPLEMLV
ncbi:dihydrolipoyllysine-residue acetyltransferase component of pyruvate dehydrogenase complex, mitochondrial [Diutina rugosa]